MMREYRNDGIEALGHMHPRCTSTRGELRCDRIAGHGGAHTTTRPGVLWVWMNDEFRVPADATVDFDNLVFE